MDVFHEQLGVFLGEVVVEELGFHVHDHFMAEGPGVKKRTKKIVDTHLAAKEVKSS